MHYKINQYNEKGEQHGYWNRFIHGSGYKGFFVNNIPKGYFEIDWFGTKEVQKHYYAR